MATDEINKLLNNYMLVVLVEFTTKFKSVFINGTMELFCIFGKDIMYEIKSKSKLYEV